MNKLQRIQLFILAPVMLYTGFLTAMYLNNLFKSLWINFSKSEYGQVFMRIAKEVTLRVRVQANRAREVTGKMGQFIKAKISNIIKRRYLQKAIRSSLEKAGIHKRKLQDIDYKKKK